MSWKRVGTITFFCLRAATSAWSLDIEPVISAKVLLGQYFFQSQESNLSGNIGILAAPALQFNPKWSLIPSLNSNWQGTKSVQDLVGGGTIFQQSQSHALQVKGIYTMNHAWQLKSGGGYTLQLYKETTNESWTKGLYDYDKFSYSLEAERSFGENKSLRFGYNLYAIDFRNFSSLESQNKDLGRENAAAKTLNTQNHSPYVATSWKLPFFAGQSMKLDAAYAYTRRSFTQQKVVALTGDLTGDSRGDQLHLLQLGGVFPSRLPWELKMLGELKTNVLLLNSNQNNYDAAKTRFNNNYYAYREISLSPTANVLIGPRPIVATLGFSYVSRNYSDRPTQDAGGTYLNDTISVNEYYLNLGWTYPINKNFRVIGQGNFGWSRSNMKYERTYRYNYETFSYLLGVSYDY